jgi:hypothetical protein
MRGRRNFHQITRALVEGDWWFLCQVAAVSLSVLLIAYVIVMSPKWIEDWRWWRIERDLRKGRK